MPVLGVHVPTKFTLLEANALGASMASDAGSARTVAKRKPSFARRPPMPSFGVPAVDLGRRARVTCVAPCSKVEPLAGRHKLAAPPPGVPRPVRPRNAHAAIAAQYGIAVAWREKEHSSDARFAHDCGCPFRSARRAWSSSNSGVTLAARARLLSALSRSLLQSGEVRVAARKEV